MFRFYNPNPAGTRVGDCSVRAISKALGLDWEQSYTDLCLYGLTMHDMPSSNSVWGRLLQNNGYMRHPAPQNCPDCITVREFTNTHPQGRYVLALSGHTVAVEDGDYFDTWDSGDEQVFYFWEEQ